MNLSVVSRAAMKTLASSQEPIDEQLHILKKIILDFERAPEECSHRACQDLRANLKRIRETPGIKPDQTRDALALRKRIPAIDPRRIKIEEEEQQAEERKAASEAPLGSEEHRQFVASNYVDGEWYLCPTPPGDESEFLRLLDVERKKRESCPEPEFAVFQDQCVRDLITAYRLNFTPDDLLQYAGWHRGPFSHNGALTPGGKSRADVLLCRERLIAGKSAPADRKPDLTKLKDYVSPLFWELFVERH